MEALTQLETGTIAETLYRTCYLLGCPLDGWRKREITIALFIYYFSSIFIFSLQVHARELMEKCLVYLHSTEEA